MNRFVTQIEQRTSQLRKAEALLADRSTTTNLADQCAFDQELFPSLFGAGAVVAAWNIAQIGLKTVSKEIMTNGANSDTEDLIRLRKRYRRQVQAAKKNYHERRNAILDAKSATSNFPLHVDRTEHARRFISLANALVALAQGEKASDAVREARRVLEDQPVEDLHKPGSPEKETVVRQVQRAIVEFRKALSESPHITELQNRSISVTVSL